MSNSQFHTAISAPRFERYLRHCDYNRQRALKLYRANIRLSQQLYAVIGQFEVVLRNTINRHYRKKYGPGWLADAVQVGGFLDTAAGCEETYHHIHDAIQRLGRKYCPDSLVANLTFGFWTY